MSTYELTQCYYVLSQPYINNRDLHSFPTRRSSDLQLLLRRPAPILALLAQPSLLVGRAAHADPDTGQPLRGLRALRRSEEHTSELQSHSDLVCRLLLEKNKINNNIDNRHERNEKWF